MNKLMDTVCSKKKRPCVRSLYSFLAYNEFSSKKPQSCPSLIWKVVPAVVMHQRPSLKADLVQSYT